MSKVVRPLQIKDHSCMYMGGEWEGLQQAMCGIKKKKKCVGADAVLLGPCQAPDPPTKEREQ